MRFPRDVYEFFGLASALHSQPRVRLTRDLVMFGFGMLLAFNEAFLANTDRPNILYLAGGLMGVAAYLRAMEVGKAGK